MHFISFLIDLILWTSFGFGLGWTVAYIEQQSHERWKKAIKFSLIAFAIGLYTVFDEGLPDAGIAAQNSFIVFVLSSAWVLLTSHKVRTLVSQEVKSLIATYQLYLKGGEVHGNSS